MMEAGVVVMLCVVEVSNFLSVLYLNYSQCGTVANFENLYKL